MKTFGVRLEQDLADRIEGIRAQLAQGMLPGMHATSGDVLRAAIIAGLPLLERQTAKPPKRRRGKA